LAARIKFPAFEGTVAFSNLKMRHGVG
jgi:hypothetical protein